MGWLDISPRSLIQSVRQRLGAFTENGFIVPGSIRKTMKGITSQPGSPDFDIINKLPGMRGLNRDLFMNAPLSTAILRRHRTLKFGIGLQVQSVIDREYLGIDSKTARVYEKSFEREFDLWAESFCSDYDGINFYGDNQGLAYLNMLLSGDYFWMPVWRNPREDMFPYELCLKLIDADLVRNPTNLIYGDKDIKGGVEKDADGQVVAYYVWNTYPNEYKRAGAKWTRVPVFDTTGRRQIYHVYHPERISQRRGTPLLANTAESLKQLTRLSEAELMSALVSSFFTVFIKDMSGLGSLMGPALTPEEVVSGGGRYGPDEAEVGERYPQDGNDLEMGHGNITYIDDKKDVTFADPGKADKNFDKFWESLATVTSAAGNMPIERALMKYESSYTAARAAANDDYKHWLEARSIVNRKMNQPMYVELMTEAVVRNRLQLKGFFEDYSIRRAWTRSYWVGSGQGSLDPLREAKASVIRLNANLTNREEEYAEAHGGRWDASIDKYAREEEYLADLGLENRPDPEELVGPDGQENEEDNEETDDSSQNT